MKKVIVIGAGVGGLATAIRLQAKGHDVTVFESNTYPGGKLTETGDENYRFDAGPSLFTMPEKVDELLNLAEPDPTGFKYERLDEICRYFYEDSTVIHGWGDPEKFAKEAQKKLGVKAKVVRKHLSKSAFIFRATNHLFLEKSLHKAKSYLNWQTIVSLLKLPLLNTHRSMNAVNKQVLKHPKLVQLFNRYATYNGSNPYQAPGILNIIPHLEFGQGAYFPKGGMHQITKSLFQKAKSLGVEFEMGSSVKSVKVKNGKAVSAEDLSGNHKADVIVSNVDIVPFYRKLLPDQKQPEKIIAQERSSSALIFYWGIKRSFENLILHNIFFSEDYQAEFDHIFKKKTIFEDPTIYINITSKHQKTDAPEGCENWFVMINVPSDQGQDWDELIAKSRSNILDKLSRMLKKDIGPLIEYESILYPRAIEQKTSSYQGALYGTASNKKMAAFFRHPNFSSDIKNLYFCGGSVHPGGGIPLALSSAKILGDLIK